jgi:magnesium chelatase family protein
VRARVVEARRRQSRRGFAPNATIPDRALDAAVGATPEARRLLGRAVDRLSLTARAARRVLKVARSVADLEGDGRVAAPHVAEALGFRDLDAPGV